LADSSKSKIYNYIKFYRYINVELGKGVEEKKTDAFLEHLLLQQAKQ